jgi:hypothetical protein
VDLESSISLFYSVLSPQDSLLFLGALYLSVFEQPGSMDFFSVLLLELVHLFDDLDGPGFFLELSPS